MTRAERLILCGVTAVAVGVLAGLPLLIGAGAVLAVWGWKEAGPVVWL